MKCTLRPNRNPILLILILILILMLACVGLVLCKECNWWETEEFVLKPP